MRQGLERSRYLPASGLGVRGICVDHHRNIAIIESKCADQHLPHTMHIIHTAIQGSLRACGSKINKHMVMMSGDDAEAEGPPCPATNSTHTDSSRLPPRGECLHASADMGSVASSQHGGTACTHSASGSATSCFISGKPNQTVLRRFRQALYCPFIYM